MGDAAPPRRVRARPGATVARRWAPRHVACGRSSSPSRWGWASAWPRSPPGAPMGSPTRRCRRGPRRTPRTPCPTTRPSHSRQPIPADPELDPRSAAIAGQLAANRTIGTVNLSSRSDVPPVYVVTPSDPFYSVTVDGKKVRFRVPAGTRPGGGEDHPLVLLDPHHPDYGASTELRLLRAEVDDGGADAELAAARASSTTTTTAASSTRTARAASPSRSPGWAPAPACRSWPG